MSKASGSQNRLAVDEFVQTRVLPEFHPVVAAIRKLMKDCAPDAQEIISYGIPAYRGRLILAVISPTKKDITLAFSHGAEFEDKYGLLRGVGKVSKHIKLRKLSDVNPEILRYYVQQAMELDARQP
jgi:hypothetical protein